MPATGGEVRLLDGTYNVEATIILDTNQTIRGNGKNTILTTSTDRPIFIRAVGREGKEKTGNNNNRPSTRWRHPYVGDAGILFYYVD